MKLAALAALLALAALGACSSSSPSTAARASGASVSSSAAPSTAAVDQACIDEFVAAVNGMDLTDVNPIDGLDSAELQKVDAQLAAIMQQHPDLAAGGRCHVLLDQRATLDDATVQQIIGKLKPDVLATLSFRGAASSSS